MRQWNLSEGITTDGMALESVFGLQSEELLNEREKEENAPRPVPDTWTDLSQPSHVASPPYQVDRG